MPLHQFCAFYSGLSEDTNVDFALLKLINVKIFTRHSSHSALKALESGCRSPKWQRGMKVAQETSRITVALNALNKNVL